MQGPSIGKVVGPIQKPKSNVNSIRPGWMLKRTFAFVSASGIFLPEQRLA
jgi:hypothetical protein